MAVPSSGTEEVFARDNSNQFEINPQQLAPNQMLGGLNSQPLALSVTGKGMQQQKGMNRHESNQFMMPASAVAPVAQTHFKVISYNNDQNENNWNQGENTQGMGDSFNVGVMGGQNELEQNRDINMAELHELLGN